MTHPAVQHPHELLVAERAAVARVNDWLAQHLALVFGSVWTIWTFIVVPLAALLMPDGAQKVIFFLASGWIQLFALPLFVYVSNRVNAKQDAKADADHQAQVHMATVGDDTNRLVRALADNLGIDPATGENRLPRPRT